MLTAHRLSLLAVAGALLALSGCVVSPYPGGYYQTSAVVTVAPPVAVEEPLGYAPYPGYVWLGGYWNWNGGRHVWVPGRWDAPRPGYHYVPHTWVREGSGYRLHGGNWAR